MAVCQASIQSRRRLFWATQPDACGTTQSCGSECGSPGLRLVEDDTNGTATISTDNYLQGLVLNMLLTDGREPNTNCGYYPGAQGGHWSESYMQGSSAQVGTLMHTVSPKASVRQTVAVINAQAQATLQRLVDRGVARSVQTKVEYIGDGRFSLGAEIKGVTSSGNARVSVTGERLSNGWVWQ